jgi:DNA-binding GntR family transcriptional regulator
MRKAVLAMQQQWKIRCRRGSGIYIGRAPHHHAPPAKPPRLLQWEVLKSKLDTDIYEGTFRDAEYLPSLKELTHSYLTSLSEFYP